MTKQIPRSALLSVACAAGALVANQIMRPTGSAPPATPIEQGQAEGAAFGVGVLCVIGIVFAIVAWKSTTKGDTRDRLVAICGLILNVATLGLVIAPMFLGRDK